MLFRWLRTLSRHAAREAGGATRPSPPQRHARLPSSVAPVAGRHADTDFVRRSWDLHRRHHPDLTWPRFLEILERRFQFFAEERRDREVKLDQLNRRDRFTP